MKFYDTCALLNVLDAAFENKFCVAIQTLEELENIKTSTYKDGETKYKARRLAHLISEHPDAYEVYYSKINDEAYSDIEINNDAKICYNAFVAYSMHKNEPDGFVFCTDDICCKILAKEVFGLPVESTKDESADDYVGYIDVSVDDEKSVSVYENPTENVYSCKINEYIVIHDADGNSVDKLRWDGNSYVPCKKISLKSTMFGDVKPYKGDAYQHIAIDSMSQNKITMLTGPAGTGKSYLAMAYLFKQLDVGKIDRIIVFCNTVSTKNAARLGFLPGTRNEKLLESSIGNMLSSKLGGMYAVESLLASNKLLILPMCDVRGYDTTGMNAGIYITEAQNMDIELMKLALQRIGDDCICIIDGDHETQVDMNEFSGVNNGMKRLSSVFRGQDFYGEVKLKNIYRSRIAELAQLM